MTRKQEISKLIEIVKLLTDRCKKIEVDSLRHIKELKQRIPTGQFGNPINIYNAINFLVENDYINGTSIDINGCIL